MIPILLAAALQAAVPPAHIAALEARVTGSDAPAACVEAERIGARGDAAATRIAAWCYDTGTGVAPDPAHAARLYRIAADAGDAHAQWRYGVMLDTGEGVGAPNPVEALAWFHKAARQGSTNAYVSLGVMFSNGRGVARDHEKALAAYREAARRGSPDALWHIGVIHFRGEGVEVDQVEGMAWVMASAMAGVDRAAQILGMMIDNVDRPTRDRATARAAEIMAEHGITPPAVEKGAR